jgi:hypothetical protein
LTCAIDGAAAVSTAAKKGYGFRSLEERHKGGATCRLVKNGEILVVSASASADGECAFEIFVPPKDTPLRIVRLALKSVADGSTLFLQRGDKVAQGFAMSLPALKGTTTQYRVMYVEVDSVDGACDKAEIGAQP